MQFLSQASSKIVGFTTEEILYADNTSAPIKATSIGKLPEIFEFFKQISKVHRKDSGNTITPLCILTNQTLIWQTDQETTLDRIFDNLVFLGTGEFGRMELDPEEKSLDIPPAQKDSVCKPEGTPIHHVSISKKYENADIYIWMEHLVQDIMFSVMDENNSIIRKTDLAKLLSFMINSISKSVSDKKFITHNKTRVPNADHLNTIYLTSDRIAIHEDIAEDRAAGLREYFRFILKLMKNYYLWEVEKWDEQGREICEAINKFGKENLQFYLDMDKPSFGVEPSDENDYPDESDESDS
jgi:hypothetical protein